MLRSQLPCKNWSPFLTSCLAPFSFPPYDEFKIPYLVAIPRRHSAKGVFKIHPHTSGLNFLNNISVPRVTANIREIEHDTTFWNLLAINLQDMSVYNFIEWSKLNLRVKIYFFQITGKCIYLSWNCSPTLTWSDH